MYDLLTEKFEGERYGGYHHNELPDYAEDYYRFCTIRSPYNKFASAWSLILNLDAIHNQQILDIVGKIDLISVLKWCIKDRDRMIFHGLNGLKIGAALTPSSVYFKHRLNNMEMDKIIHIENATEQFNEMYFVDEYTVVPKVFSMANAPYYKTWDDICTQEVTELVNEWAGDDFEMFGYDKQ
jgi:hypothetical protein